MIMTSVVMVYFRLVWGKVPAFGLYLLVGLCLVRALPRLARLSFGTCQDRVKFVR